MKEWSDEGTIPSLTFIRTLMNVSRSAKYGMFLELKGLKVNSVLFQKLGEG